nr:transposase, MuDR, MULE transposase domain protein [Tanacetum cinerariifolium]
MSVEELVGWAEEETRSPYLRSPPLKSRPFRNDMKGRVLFTDMYYAEDEGFEMYPPLNDNEADSRGYKWGKNDASKSVEFTQGVQGAVDGITEGMNDSMDVDNIDIDEQVLARQKKLNKGKSKPSRNQTRSSGTLQRKSTASVRGGV